MVILVYCMWQLWNWVNLFYYWKCNGTPLFVIPAATLILCNWRIWLTYASAIERHLQLKFVQPNWNSWCGFHLDFARSGCTAPAMIVVTKRHAIWPSCPCMHIFYMYSETERVPVSHQLLTIICGPWRIFIRTNTQLETCPVWDGQHLHSSTTDAAYSFQCCWYAEVSLARLSIYAAHSFSLYAAETTANRQEHTHTVFMASIASFASNLNAEFRQTGEISKLVKVTGGGTRNYIVIMYTMLLGLIRSA